MSKRRRISLCAVQITAFIMMSAVLSAGQCPTGRFDDWLQCRINLLMQKNLKSSATHKQADQPSASSASTSLLDRTSAPDLAGIGLQLLGAGQQAGSNQSGSTTVTASLYAMTTAISGSNPLDPAVYAAGRNSRRMSLTLGNEAASAQNNQTKYKIFGGKFLMLDSRDVNSKYANSVFKKASSKLSDTNTAYNALALQVKQFLYRIAGPRIDSAQYPVPGTLEAKATFAFTELSSAKLGATIELLTVEELKQIDDMANASVVEAFSDEAQQFRDIVGNIQKAPQLSFSYIAKMADQDASNSKIDVHRMEAIFDYGLNDWINVNVNASYDYHNSHQRGLDKKGGRAAGSFEFKMNNARALAKGIAPFTMSLNGEATFLSNVDPIYQMQARLDVPLTKGLSLPMSVTLANRTEFIKESDVRGQFGFTIDVSKLAGLFTSGQK